MADEEVEDFERRQRDKFERILASHVAQLGEHFDSVQVIVTHYDPQEGTGMSVSGTGNYYARLASTEDWLRECRRK